MSESNRILYPKAAMERWLGSGAAQSSYTLEEFGKLIEPTYQVYDEYIRRCVVGLTTIAAQRAALHQAPMWIKKLPVRWIGSTENPLIRLCQRRGGPGRRLPFPTAPGKRL